MTPPITPIGDMGVANLTENVGGSVTWEVAADWDNSVSEAGSVHEATAGTDYTDATILQKGNPVATPSPAGSPIIYLAMHEDSGTTVNDFSANSQNGTASGATPGTAGPVGTTAWSFDGGNDYIQVPSFAGMDAGASFSISFWLKFDSNPGTEDWTITNRDDRGNGWFVQFRSADGGACRFGTNNGNIQTTKSSWNTGQWYHISCVQIDSSTAKIYVDGVEEASGNNGFAGQSGGNDLWIATRGQGSSPDTDYFPGSVWGYRYDDAAFTATETGEIYDGVRGQSSLTTATKSLAGSVQPDFTNLLYSLNSGGITLKAIGSPGTASEETVSQVLDGASGYAVSWSNSHSDFRVKIIMSNSDAENTPTVDSITLSA